MPTPPQTPLPSRHRPPKAQPRVPKPAAALDAHDLSIARELADLFDMWALCGRPPCRRARACRAANAPCLAEYRDTFRELTLELAAWPPLHVGAEDEWED